MPAIKSKTQQILNIYGVILIVWSVYRWKLSLPDWFDEFIAKPLVFVLPVYWLITRIEGKKFLDEIWFDSKKAPTDLLVGLALGAVFMATALAAQFARTGELNLLAVEPQALLLGAVVTLFTAVSEEILCRGFILKRFFQESQSVYLASFNASLLFLVLHIPILFTIPDLRGSLLLLVLFTDFILSLINSFVFLDRKSILAPILIHSFYNAAIFLFI